MVLQTPPPRGAQATMRAALLIAAAAGALAFAPVQPPVSLRASAAFARPATRREGLASGLRVGRTRPLLGGLHASAASGQATDAAAAATVRKGVTPSDLEAFDAQVRARHDQHNNEIMNDLFRPVTKESEAPLPGRILAGAVPSDFPGGALLKNGPNAHFEASGGWLDGDGMVHCCVVSPAGDDEFTAYSRAWVRTEAFKKEEAAGRRLFDGSLVAPKGLGVLWALFLNTVRALQPQKDTANTGLLPIGGGRVLAMMEQALPSELQVFRDGSVRCSPQPPSQALRGPPPRAARASDRCGPHAVCDDAQQGVRKATRGPVALPFFRRRAHGAPPHRPRVRRGGRGLVPLPRRALGADPYVPAGWRPADRRAGEAARGAAVDGARLCAHVRGGVRARRVCRHLGPPDDCAARAHAARRVPCQLRAGRRGARRPLAPQGRRRRGPLVRHRAVRGTPHLQRPPGTSAPPSLLLSLSVPGGSLAAMPRAATDVRGGQDGDKVVLTAPRTVPSGRGSFIEVPQPPQRLARIALPPPTHPPWY